MITSWWLEVGKALSHVLDREIRPAKVTPVGGGCINQASCLSDQHGTRYFVKTNRESARDMFAVEAAGLEAIQATQTLRVPRVLGFGCHGGRAYLALEWLDLGSGRSEDAHRLGRDLARLHQCDVGDRFGWHRDNFIGSSPQPNPWESDWATFFLEHRLRYQVDMAHRNGHRFARFDRLAERVPDLLRGLTIRPALVHGDLWTGNAAYTETGVPAVFDVAAYYGHGETDLAMSELFGGFGTAFFEGYTELRPLEAGYPLRRTLYNLYHIINHFNLFGGGYASQAQSMIDALL
ncbi:Fructosamine kinase family protein [Sulfidibacter corallicola]|uniref:Fructosamine kinase family protein n=1 Tax=Sulfidibacter corallicola TaxID=2818388 RepID=A0A8A4TTL7_SULCO|nr:fructosamine kinase family protein [Sulfidibacter corallicola]QTD52717.1 fructosamine kinase family protein [Sulfidibacter corallicola]